jgi:anti-anti-sigma factor
MGMEELVVSVPSQLIAETRVEFRDRAMAALAKLAGQPASSIVLDLTRTTRLDSSGLGALVMLQLRAAEQQCAVWLRGASEEIRCLLLMTKLEDRFRVEGRDVRP